MSSDGPPGDAPDVAVELEADHGTQRTPQGFLRLRCRSLRRRLSDGTLSEPFKYDTVEREFLDAVVIVLFRRSAAGVEVCLRSQLRVPLLFRDQQHVPDPGCTRAVLWELPAGLIEPGESGFEGVAHRASLETHEETGYRVAAERFRPLGPPALPTPGLVAEKFHFVQAELRDSDLGEAPAGDGHALEEGATLQFVELSAALRAADAGQLPDLKTELGLRRFAALEGGAR